ncbi:MAG: hypothetical protein ABIB71_03685 [Candidatus Woesearchaeota archaeon]
MIDAANFNTVLTEYAVRKYKGRIAEFHKDFYPEFPYKIEGLDEQGYIRNFMD